MFGHEKNVFRAQNLKSSESARLKVHHLRDFAVERAYLLDTLAYRLSHGMNLSNQITTETRKPDRGRCARVFLFTLETG